ncbi:MAG: helix-turn-helix domain-containing protein [Pseudomonadales bacterium]|nr:helix-turn-helix domain-containing protein [Pseudomonadales bacterium]
MPRIAPPLSLSRTDRAELERFARKGSTSPNLAVRARIAGKATDGWRKDEIAESLGISRPTASKWRKRFPEGGMAALNDAPRSGRPRSLTSDRVSKWVHLSLQEDLRTPPTGACARWGGRRDLRLRPFTRSGEPAGCGRIV